MLSLVFRSTVHAFEIMLAAFIGGLACGNSAWIRRRIDHPACRCVCSTVQIAMGIAALISLVLYDRSFDAVARACNSCRTRRRLRAVQRRYGSWCNCDHGADCIFRRHDLAIVHACTDPRWRRRAQRGPHLLGQHTRRDRRHLHGRTLAGSADGTEDDHDRGGSGRSSDSAWSCCSDSRRRFACAFPSLPSAAWLQSPLRCCSRNLIQWR